MALLSALLKSCDELFPQIETLYGVPAHAIITRSMLFDDHIQWAEDQLPNAQMLAIRIPERVSFAEGTKNEFVRSHDLDAIMAIVQHHDEFVAVVDEFAAGPMPGLHLHIQPIGPSLSGR